MNLSEFMTLKMDKPCSPFKKLWNAIYFIEFLEKDCISGGSCVWISFGLFFNIDSIVRGQQAS